MLQIKNNICIQKCRKYLFLGDEGKKKNTTSMKTALEFFFAMI